MRKNHFSVNLKANVAYCRLIVEIVSSFRSCTSCAFSWRYCRFDCHTGTSGKKQFKPSSLAIGGLEFVIFCSTLLFYLFLDQAAKILGEKKKMFMCHENAIFNKKFLQRSVKITTKFVFAFM